MLYFLAFSFYDDDKQQLRWPSEESICFRSCRLGYNSKSAEHLTFSIKGTVVSVLVMMVMTICKTQPLGKFRTGFSFSFGFDVS